MYLIHFSAYQVIVLQVANGAKELPADFDSRLKNVNDAYKDNFYVAAEIENDPVHGESWQFTVGDDKTYGGYMNKELEREEEYIVYQRAVTHDNKVSLNKGKKYFSQTF